MKADKEMFINVSAGGTFGNVTVDNIRLDGNEVDTTSGNLILDSTGGTVSVDDNLTVIERFTSNNGPVFYDLPINEKKITIVKEKWILPEYTIYKNVKIKNFFGGKELNWKVVK